MIVSELRCEARVIRGLMMGVIVFTSCMRGSGLKAPAPYSIELMSDKEFVKQYAWSDLEQLIGSFPQNLFTRDQRLHVYTNSIVGRINPLFIYAKMQWCRRTNMHSGGRLRCSTA